MGKYEKSRASIVWSLALPALAGCSGSAIEMGTVTQDRNPNQPSTPASTPAGTSAMPGVAMGMGATNPTSSGGTRDGQVMPVGVSMPPSAPTPTPTPMPAPATCVWRSATAGPGSDAIAVATPFAAPANNLTFTPPSIPCNIFDIRAYGAVGDGTTSNTQAFAAAVAAAGAAGGGVVYVPAGNWLSGPIHLASKIELHVEQGASILFSQTFSDYLPPVLTRWEGLDVMNYSPMLYALDATDVAITGTGTLDAQGSVWWPWKDTSAAEDQRIYDLVLAGKPAAERVSGVEGGLRPTFVECNHCTNLLIEGVTTQNGPYWTVHPLYSSNVIVRDAHITSNASGTNGDGVNPDSSNNVLIQNVLFETSDDCIAVKSGLNEDGIAVGKPSENLVIRNIRSLRGHGGVSIGSEMSGGIHNLWATDSDLQGIERPIRIKTLPGRGGVMSDLFYDNLTIAWTKNAFEITTNYPSSTIPPNDPTLLPQLENVTIHAVNGTSTAPIYNVEGLLAMPFADVLLDTLTLGGAPGACLNAAGIQLRDVTIDGVAAGSGVLPCN